VLVVADDPGAEALAEQVAPAAVAGVEALRVASVQPLEPRGEAIELGLDHKVVVVAHQAVGVDAPAVALGDAGEQTEERESILVVSEDRRARDAARGHVVDRNLREHVTREPRHRHRR
jgi:hypothetical protein